MGFWWSQESNSETSNKKGTTSVYWLLVYSEFSAFPPLPNNLSKGGEISNIHTSIHVHTYASVHTYMSISIFITRKEQAEGSLITGKTIPSSSDTGYNFCLYYSYPLSYIYYAVLLLQISI